MKVKDLVEMLQSLDQDKRIVIMDTEGPFFKCRIEPWEAYDRELDDLVDAYQIVTE